MSEKRFVSYESLLPEWYRCCECGAQGVRLYRMYEVSTPNIKCLACSLREQHRDKPDNQWQHTIGWRVLAVPVENGIGFWGYTSVPDGGVKWWNELPVEPGKGE